ncbi:MAG: nucleoside hydrolase [Chthoniobacterales bacterium]
MGHLGWIIYGCHLIAAVVLPLSSAKGARVVWIDTDLSIGSPLREVDDAYALLLALRSPELRVAGVSTTYGNAPLRATTQRTRDSLGTFGAKVTVDPGAASARDLGRKSAASAAVSAALHREKLTYIALGPLTNLATFLRLHPEQAKRIEQVVMIAGKTPGASLGFGPEEKFRIHDANLVKDPAAVREVLRSQIPVLLVPIETSSCLQLDRADLDKLAASGAAGKYLAPRSRVWLWFWTHIAKTHGGPIFDALAIVAVAQPSLVKIETRSASFDAHDQLLVRQADGRKVGFCVDFAPATKATILGRLTGRTAISSGAPRDR